MCKLLPDELKLSLTVWSLPRLLWSVLRHLSLTFELVVFIFGFSWPTALFHLWFSMQSRQLCHFRFTILTFLRQFSLLRWIETYYEHTWLVTKLTNPWTRYEPVRLYTSQLANYYQTTSPGCRVGQHSAPDSVYTQSDCSGVVLI